MRKTKVFRSGNSQAVRLPRDFQLDVDEVEIFKRNDELVIRKIPTNLAQAFTILTKMPKDFMSKGREDELPQDRDFE